MRVRLRLRCEVPPGRWDEALPGWEDEPGHIRRGMPCPIHHIIRSRSASRPRGPGGGQPPGTPAPATGLDPASAAHVAAYLAISGPATAAQRLLSLDPLIVATITAGLCTAIDAVADRAARDHAEPGSALYAMCALSDPWFDLLAETHASRKDRLFAS